MKSSVLITIVIISWVAYQLYLTPVSWFLKFELFPKCFFSSLTITITSRGESPKHLFGQKNTNHRWISTYNQLLATSIVPTMRGCNINRLINTKLPIPKYPDPSKLAILRTYTPLLYRFKPFHWRVQRFLGMKHFKTMKHLEMNAPPTEVQLEISQQQMIQTVVTS